jgi:hypothetical protein
VFASAIAFLVLFAIIPPTRFGLGLLGGLGLEEQRASESAPAVRDSTSPAAFRVVDEWAGFGASARPPERGAAPTS